MRCRVLAGLFALAGAACSEGDGAPGDGNVDAAPGADGTSADATTSGPDASRATDGGLADSAATDGTPVDTGTGALTYDEIVLADDPVAYWAMTANGKTEPDLTGNGNTGTYLGGSPIVTTLPNGDPAADLNGSSESMNVASNASLSIPTTGSLTWEGWIRPDVVQFSHDDGSSGYVDWMGKCDSYGGPPPTCEWEARMYDTTTHENPNRPNRLSAYVFNPSAGLGSAADWQPNAGLIQVATWYHVVGEYTTATQPSDCFTGCQAANAGCANPVTSYPGAINIWVDGVEWNQASHGTTGCMCQYCVAPVAHGSGLNVGTMAMDTWFAGAVGKVAIYGHLLTAAQVANHYHAMTGAQPAGSCADTCSL